MKSSADPREELDVSRSRANAFSLILSMADTTWRMFTPSIILVGLGIWADLKIGTRPWLAVAGAVLGLTASILLVKRQLGVVK